MNTVHYVNFLGFTIKHLMAEMKISGAILFLAFIGVTFGCSRNEISQISEFTSNQEQLLKQTANSYIVSFAQADLKKLATLTHSRFIKEMGGKTNFIETMRQSIESNQKNGIQITGSSAGQPTQPIIVGDLIISFVPTTIVTASSTLRVTSYSHLLGISADKGETWKIVDLFSISDEKARNLFPEIGKEVVFPESKNATGEEIEANVRVNE